LAVYACSLYLDKVATVVLPGRLAVPGWIYLVLAPSISTTLFTRISASATAGIASNNPNIKKRSVILPLR
jgi:hypothetical protein